MLTPIAPRVAGRVEGLLSSRWLSPLNDLEAIEDLIGRFDATWSLTRIKARVVAAIHETADVRTLILRPNRLWPGHAAGQHVLVEAELDGRRVRRTFSVSSPPRADGTLSITVKRRPAGKLSVWWNERASAGDVLTLGVPAGDFVLPAQPPRQIVMLSAGSGITPVMALLRDLGERAPATRVLFVHCAHSRDDVIFRDELEQMAARRPRLDLRLHLTGTHGRLDAAALSDLARTAGRDLTFVCGPAGFMEAVRAAWREAGNEDRLVSERFGLPASIAGGDASAPQSVRAERSGISFVAGGGKPLLAEAEAASLTPAYGCRMGICHTCACRKASGIVEDLRTGHLSDEPGEIIQLCVSAARSPLTLDL
ncbi:MAG: ferredoxin reductase [Deltaproteobacteria bacterium]|nr:ferredoxin reductase [Deltaproteobacteria bacterium]